MLRATAADRQRAAVLGDLALRLANQVIEASAERGIVLMPLKGALLLARWPALRGERDLVDVDLLVRATDFRTMTQVLNTLDFEPTLRTSAGATFVGDAWPLSIDVHHCLFPHGMFRAPTEEVFARAALDESMFAAPVARMSDADLLGHLVGHFVKGRGTFRGDRSPDDIRWLLRQGVYGVEDAEALSAHLCELGLRRAAQYVLGHESLRREPVATAALHALGHALADHAAVAIARLSTSSNDDTPRWWTPHLLEQSLVAGSRSLLAHANEGSRRFIGRIGHRVD